ncbi:uncharacterized protein LOC144150951 [Haemaphysalis longicornis]
MARVVGLLRLSAFPWLVLVLLTHGTPPCRGSATTGDCFGRFVVEDSTVRLYIQQYVNSSDSVVECRYEFVAPEKSGLLIIAKDIRAVNDAEIPGCPVAIYNNAEASGEPVVSLCGHYSTMTIPVTTPLALVVYKPEFNGEPYTLTLDLQAALTGGSNLRACGDSELSAVPAVPVMYSVGFRADSGSGDASDFCDLNVTARGGTLGAECVLTSDGVCSYEVLLSDGSDAESPASVDLAAVGGSATVRLHPADITGVLIASYPAEFEPVTSLEPPPVVSPSEDVTTGAASDAPITDASANATSAEDLTSTSVVALTNSTAGVPLNETGSSNETSTVVPDDDGDDGDDGGSVIRVIIIDNSPPSFWHRTSNWFSDTWTTMKYTSLFTLRSFDRWFWSWF